MSRSYPKSLFLVVALIYTAGLATVSLLKLNSDALSAVEFKNADKVFHFLAYFGLTLLWEAYYFKQKQSIQGFPSLKIALAAIIFGIIIEILQKGATRYRSFEYLDIVANSTGVILAVLSLYILKHFNKLKL